MASHSAACSRRGPTTVPKVDSDSNPYLSLRFTRRSLSRGSQASSSLTSSLGACTAIGRAVGLRVAELLALEALKGLLVLGGAKVGMCIVGLLIGGVPPRAWCNRLHLPWKPLLQGESLPSRGQPWAIQSFVLVCSGLLLAGSLCPCCQHAFVAFVAQSQRFEDWGRLLWVLNGHPIH